MATEWPVDNLSLTEVDEPTDHPDQARDQIYAIGDMLKTVLAAAGASPNQVLKLDVNGYVPKNVLVVSEGTANPTYTIPYSAAEVATVAVGIVQDGDYIEFEIVTLLNALAGGAGHFTMQLKTKTGPTLLCAGSALAYNQYRYTPAGLLAYFTDCGKFKVSGSGSLVMTLWMGHTGGPLSGCYGYISYRIVRG